MKNRICGNCGADEGLHHYETRQCPKNGIEETRFDKLIGKYYPQQWEQTIFVDAEQLKLENAAPQLLESLLAVRRHGLIEKDGYETVIKKINDAIGACE